MIPGIYLIPILAGPFVATVIITEYVRRYTLRHEYLDVPNERSSHALPIPRGGGVAIVVVTLATIGTFRLVDIGAARTFSGYVIGGLMVAAVGYLDDRHHVSALWRLLVHFVAAAIVVSGVGQFPQVRVPGIELGFVWFTPVLAAVFIVWMLNLYNFMDGIDGIAAVEALTVSGAATGLLWHRGAQEFALLAAVLGTVSLGFLVWNWPPAKIFMGDVGSGFIGFSFGYLAVVTYATSAVPITVWLILLGTFIVDATVTLIRRILRHEIFYQPHRSHAYQYASRKAHSHLAVTVAVGIINVFWLFPLAVLVVVGRLSGLLALAAAYVPLVGLAFHLKAGAKEQQEF